MVAHRTALAVGQPYANRQSFARRLNEPSRGHSARIRTDANLFHCLDDLWASCRHRRRPARVFSGSWHGQYRAADGERIFDRRPRWSRQRFRISDRSLRRWLSGNDDGVSGRADIAPDTVPHLVGTCGLCATTGTARSAIGSPMVFLRSRVLWIGAAVAVIAALLPFWLSAYLLGVLTAAYYFGVFAMAWDLLFGFAGEVNFGPTFLIGLGAYTAGILNNEYGWSVYLCIVLGALASVVAGFVLALPALRVRGPYFGLTTLVAVLMLQNFVVVFADLTGGEIGMTVPDVLSIDEKVHYWYALAFLTSCAVLLYGLSRSAVGLILQASGQDAVEASALGFNVTKHKIAAFCISALFSGTAGGMLIFFMGSGP